MGGVKNLFIILIVFLVFIGCGDSSNQDSTTNSSINGVSQKGPFKKGSIVTAYKLEAGERSKTNKVSTETSDNKGNFFLNIPWNGPIEYEIKGQYLDENTGSYIADGELTAIVNNTAGINKEININIFTHLAAFQIKQKLKQNISIETAKQEAKEKLKEMFSLSLGNDRQLEDLDLTDGQSESKSDNLQLLKVSAALLSLNNPDLALQKLTEFIDSEGGINEDVINVYDDVLEKADNVDLSNIDRILKDKIDILNAPKESDREGELPFKHGLSFDTKVDVSINEGLESNYIVLNNFSGLANLSVVNGQYSLNGAAYTDVETTVESGDKLKLKHYALNSYGSKKTTTLNIGLSRITFSSITKADPKSIITSPNSFSFPIIKNANLNSVVSSKEITISGLSNGTFAKVGISRGASYKINDGEWKNNTYEDELSFSSVVNGDIIKVSNKASSTSGGKSVATLTVGDVSADFIIFTKQKDIHPDLFSPKTKYEVELNTIYETKYFTTSGYEGGLDIEVINGEAQLEGESEWLSIIPQVPTSQKIKFRQRSSTTYEMSKKTTIKLGKSIIDFETITKTNPNISSANPNSIIFKTKFDEEIDSFVESEERIITGMQGSATYAYPSQGSQISVNGEEWTSEPVSISLGTRVKLRMKTSLSYDYRNIRYIYYGPDKKLFSRFDVYTKKKDVEIDDINFINKNNVALNTYYESDTVTISGISSPACAKVTNGEFRFNGNEWTSSDNKICFENGQTLQLRHKSSKDANSSVYTIVSFDTKQYEFKTTTSSAPQVLNKPIEVINQNSNYEFTPNVRDNHTLTFSLQSKPTWMNIDSSTGKITGIPTQDDIGQSDTIRLLVKSSSGLEESRDFKVTVNDVNDAPLLNDTWNSDTIDERSSYSRKASAIDIEGGSLKWSISNNPSWLSINEQTGEISGVPTQADVGTKEKIRVSVEEEDSLVSYFEFDITVIDKNFNALIYEITDKTVNENEELIINVNAYDSDGDTLIFEINNEPSWMSFDSLTKKLKGTPSSNDIGEYKNVSISVTDGHGSKMWTNFDITVLDVNEAPTITSNDFTKEFILDDTNISPDNYIFTFDIADSDTALTSSNVTHSAVITETRVGFAKTAHFTNSTVDCIRGKCTANISFAFQDIDGFHPSLKTRHTFTVTDGDKSTSNYIDIWYAPTEPILSGETSHTIEPKDKTSYETFSFIPINSGNKARTWSIKNKPEGFNFNTSTGEIKYTSLAKGLLLEDTTFKGIEITASNDRGISNKFIFNITVKGKPPTPTFEFIDKAGVEIQQWFDSSIIVDWLDVSEEVSISSSGYLGQAIHSGFKVNGQANVIKVKNGDKVTVWHKSSNEYDTTLNTTITIGNNSDTFSTKTKANQDTRLPLIVGAPNTRANVGEVYTYTPTLSTDYTKLAPATKDFTIENKPSWASFDVNTGKLSGTPTEATTHNQVRITAFGDSGLDDITFNIEVTNDAPYINGFGHSLDNPDLSFTFTDNENWRNSITEVAMYGCYDRSNTVVLNSSDYTFSEGSLKLHPSVSTNPMLHIPFMGGAGLIIKSSIYPDREVLIDMIEDGQYAVKASLIEFADNKPITESNLNTARVNVFLSNELKFKDNTLDKSNFSLYEAPNGVSILSVGYINNTIAQITLSFDGSDFDEHKLLQFAISADELNVCQEVITNKLDVQAIIEDTWKNILYPSNPTDNASFGKSVDIKNGTIAVGANTGVYIFKKDVNGDYKEVQIIEKRISTNSTFAKSVSLDGDYLVIGDDSFNGPNNSVKFTGAAYIYKKDANGKYQFLRDITPNTLQEFDHFGNVVDISGDLILVGAFNADNHKGLAYLFKNDGNDNFNLVETISRPNAKPNDFFAFDLAIDGNYFVIGSDFMFNDQSTPFDQKPELGAGFVNYYSYIDDSLELINVIVPTDSTNKADKFGKSVSIFGDNIAIASAGSDSIYIYKKEMGTLSFERKLENADSLSGIGIYNNNTNSIVSKNATFKESEGYVKHTVPSDFGDEVSIYLNEVTFSDWNNNDKAIDGGAVLVTNVAEDIDTLDELDTTPHQFRFTDISNASLDEVVSSAVTITGINEETSISIVNGQYSLDDGVTWETEALTLQNNQVVQVRHTASSVYATTTDTSLTVGGISDTFSSTTMDEPLKTAPSITSTIGFSLETDEFNFFFTDNELWRNSISKIYYRAGIDGTYSLLDTSDYSITSGQIKLNVKDTTNVALRTPYTGSGSIKIIANRYEDNTHPIGIVSTGKNAIKVENSAHQDNNPITELNLDGTKLYVILGNELEFIDNSLALANLSLSVAPVGTSISNVMYNDSTSAIVTLAYDGTDFDVDSQVNVVVNKEELNTSVDVTAKYPITVKAVDEQVGNDTTGQAIDPYIVDARFWYDLDGDLQEDSDELSTYTDENGRFTFSIQIPENGLITMVEKGLHNGKVFTGSLSSKYSDTKKGLISPITSISALGFTDQEIIALLINNGFDSNLNSQELYLDPFDSTVLLNNGDLSSVSDEQKAKFRRVLLANVIINSTTMASTTGYDISKSDLNEFFTHKYSVGAEGAFDGAPDDTTILKFLISLGNEILSNENLNAHSKVRARIFVTVAEYVSNRIKKTIVSGSNPIWEFESILSEAQNMINPLTHAYIKALMSNISNPKIAWLEINSIFRPMLMINNSMIGNSKKIKIFYKDSSDDEQTIEFVRDNHDFIENSISSGQWLIQNRKVLANGKEYRISGNKIIVNGEIYNITDVVIQNEDDTLDNFYEELPLFVSSNPEDNETFVNVNAAISITYDRVPSGIHTSNTKCFLRKTDESISTQINPRFLGASISYNPDEDFLYNQEYLFSCSISYGEETSYKQIKFTTKPKAMPIMKTGQSASFNETGLEVTDNSLKDDGFYKKGEVISRVNNANLVEDITTGLMWNDDGQSTTMTMASAKLHCKTMSVDTYNNWRLPTAKEMQTLALFDGTNASSFDSFSNLTNSDYWTSTKTIESSTWNSDQYIYIRFPNLVLSENERFTKKVICVRENK